MLLRAFCSPRLVGRRCCADGAAHTPRLPLTSSRGVRARRVEPRGPHRGVRTAGSAGPAAPPSGRRVAPEPIPAGSCVRRAPPSPPGGQPCPRPSEPAPAQGTQSGVRPSQAALLESLGAFLVGSCVSSLANALPRPSHRRRRCAVRGFPRRDAHKRRRQRFAPRVACLSAVLPSPSLGPALGPLVSLPLPLPARASAVSDLLCLGKPFSPSSHGPGFV